MVMVSCSRETRAVIMNRSQPRAVCRSCALIQRVLVLQLEGEDELKMRLIVYVCELRN